MINAAAPLPHTILGVPGLNSFIHAVRATKESIGLPNAPPSWLYARPQNLRPEFMTVQRLAEELPGAEESWLTMVEEVLRHYKTSYNIKNELALIKAPTLFVISDKEDGVNTTGDLAIDMPQARKATISNAGHVPWLDDTDACKRVILGLLHNPP
jgi:pimeloyl-ACP methyl ester carboxylesterase